MLATTKSFHYQLPKKAIKIDCPQCGPRHRRTLSRYVDIRTGETLPESYGRCDRESNCGYHLSPYQKTESGLSYADEQKSGSQSLPVPKAWFKLASKQKQQGITRFELIHFLTQTKGATFDQAEQVAKYLFDKPTLPAQPTQLPVTFYIPDEVFKQSLGHYEQNQFAQLLTRQFGQPKASELLQRFQIGTSSRWPGACVFWLLDEQSRARSGQVVLFGDDWHKARYIDQEGNQKICISSVSHGLLRRYRQQNQPPPAWLTDYHNNAPRWPILFGLQQLTTSPANQPVAIVEAPKTAVVCSAVMPDFLWLAVGALSYLNAERLAPLRGRAVMLFPDLSKNGKAFAQWSQLAEQLNTKGFKISVSTILEEGATSQQREQGLDLADFLLNTPLIVKTIADQLINTGSILKPDEEQLDRLTVEPCDTYPAEWDTPHEPGTQPKIKQINFFEWQRTNPYFSQLGLASLKTRKPTGDE